MPFKEGDTANRWANMTPEQRSLAIQQNQRKKREQWMRAVGNDKGLFGDVPVYQWLAYKLSLPEDQR